MTTTGPANRRRALAATLACAGILLAVPVAAPAATTCGYASQVLQVDLGATNDTAVIGRASGAEISVRSGDGTQVTCAGVGGPPTVSNTNAISVFNHPGTTFNRVVIDDADTFAPGVIPEAGSDEIEIFVFLNNTNESVLEVHSTPTGGSTRFGTSGINPNATPAEDTPDADIFPTDVPHIRGEGSAGPDVLGAQGGAGTGNPLTTGIVLAGGDGQQPSQDRLTGGEGGDILYGDHGNDVLLGLGGNDQLVAGSAVDVVDGGPGTDEVDYSNLTSSVYVDLAGSTLPGIENVTGTLFPDVLRGDGGPNRLQGYADDDTIEGRDGTDSLEGGEGADSINARDGGPDSVDCGFHTDIVSADLPVFDTLTACENVLFPAPPGSGPGGSGSGPGAGGARSVTGSCAGKRATITGTNAGETITGTSGRDVIDARGGNDKVKGLGGNDVVCGRSGKDRVDGGRGKDAASGGTGNDRLLGSGGNDRLSGGRGNDRLSGGSGRDRLKGDAGKDNLRGGSGRDRLLGGSGRDWLVGGGGRDVLRGGRGKDSKRQ